MIGSVCLPFGMQGQNNNVCSACSIQQGLESERGTLAGDREDTSRRGRGVPERLHAVASDPDI